MRLPGTAVILASRDQVYYLTLTLAATILYALFACKDIFLAGVVVLPFLIPIELLSPLTHQFNPMLPKGHFTGFHQYEVIIIFHELSNSNV